MPKQTIDAKHANMSIDVSSKGAWLENITRNFNNKIVYLYTYRQGKRYGPLSGFSNISSLVISQKDEFQNGYSKKQSTPHFPKNKHFLQRVSCTCAYQGVKNSVYRASVYDISTKLSLNTHSNNTN